MPVPEDLSFDAATSLHPLGDGHFGADVHPLWAVGDKPNGGYLLALLGRAARDAAREPRPAKDLVGSEPTREAWEVQSATVTYLRPPTLGPATIRTTVLRHGRSAAHVRAVLTQEDVDLVDAVFVLGVLGSAVPVRYDGTPPLRVREPERCVRLPSQVTDGLHVGINEVLELRLDPETLPFTDSPPPPGTPAELRGWTRFADGREPDALSLLFSADAIPPATLMIGSTGWVPTLQLSTYVRAHPAPGWLGIRISANVVADGTVDETCVLWDGGGRVVAQSSQLARLRFPDEPA